MSVTLRWLVPGALDGGLLTTAEQVRAARFVHDVDRQRHVTGRAAVRVLAARCLGCDPGEVVIDTEGRGKPVVVAPSRIEVGIAHTGHVVLAGIGDAPFGIDVEQPIAATTVDELAGRVCSRGERDALSTLQRHERAAAFTRMWVRKEAVIKADGRGMSIPLDQVDVGWSVHDTPILVDGWWVRDLEVPEVAAALATRDEHPTFDLAPWDGARSA